MRNLLLALILTLCITPAFADTSFSVPHAGGDITLDDNGVVAGAIWDNPKWIGIMKNVDFGTEVRKDLMVNPFDGGTRQWVDSNDGYSIMAKVTTGFCIWRCNL